jgi:hypothetical protein
MRANIVLNFYLIKQFHILQFGIPESFPVVGFDLTAGVPM